MNLQLSKDRAASCVRYLVGKGISASRLQSEGFGETKPIATNETPEGRAKNRRTEFKVLQ
jgi:outer membrane protein OmpA-like peptidoglycan-associated protein